MLAHVMALQQIVRQLDVLTRTVALLEDRLSHTEDKVRVNYHMPWNWTCQLLFVELNVADEIEDSEGHYKAWIVTESLTFSFCCSTLKESPRYV